MENKVTTYRKGTRMPDSLGDRMKRYEAVCTHTLTRRVPVIVRVDGRAFHTLTRRFSKPFDMNFIGAMQTAAVKLLDEMQGCVLAYVQSDEASFLLTDWEKTTTEPWFGYEVNKIVSISAATMSVLFYRELLDRWLGPDDERKFRPVFDARAFNIPLDDVSNYFLWRAKDWNRNSIQMYTRSFFSHKQCHKKSNEDMHEMLHSIGKNWTTDLSNDVKNGTFIHNEGFAFDVNPNYQEVNALVQRCLPKPE